MLSSIKQTKKQSKGRIKRKNKRKVKKEYLKAKAPRLDFLPFLSVKSITRQ